MAKVTVRPLDITFEAPEGETIMGAAQKQGYYWPTTCGGEGRCTTCACVVLEGMEHLSPRGRSETKVLTEERGPAVLQQLVRLACQAHVFGDCVVEKPGLRPPSAFRVSALHSDEPEE
jgi:2Fe-2S ferredoxin